MIQTIIKYLQDILAQSGVTGHQILYVFIAAVCNSIMDVTKDHWATSPFSKLHPWTLIYKFFLWDSWRNKYTRRDPESGRWKVLIFGLWVMVPVQFTDAWHFFKMAMVMILCWAIAPNFVGWCILGIAWNVPFDVMYNVVLVSKTYTTGLFSKIFNK